MPEGLVASERPDPLNPSDWRWIGAPHVYTATMDTELSVGRPLVGHDWAVAHLIDVATPDPGPAWSRLRHAYLLTGARHIGRSTLAGQLAGTLLCREPTGTACGVCADCTSFAGGNHPDFLLVDPTTTDGEPDRDGGVLRAEQADAVLHFTVMKPFQSRFRVVLIRELQRATPAFANHLLKTFEEPPAAALLLATATNTSAILPTLVSRCQTLKLRPSSRDTLRTALQTRWGAEPERADLLSRLAQGRMGWAVLQLEDARMWQRRDRNRALATDLAASSIPERLARADALAVRSSPAQLQEQVDFWLWWWRDVWLIQHDLADGCVNVDCEDELESLAARVRATDVTAFLQRLERAIQQMRANVNGRLVMTSLMIHMPMAA